MLNFNSKTLDELAARVATRPESLELPLAGTQLKARGVAWSMRVNGADVHVMSPIDGEVIDTAHGEHGWFLRIKPSRNASFCHLLRGFEAVRWMTREMERVQLMVSESASIPALADGGMPVTIPQRDNAGMSGVTLHIMRCRLCEPFGRVYRYLKGPPFLSDCGVAYWESVRRRYGILHGLRQRLNTNGKILPALRRSGSGRRGGSGTPLVRV